MEDIRRCWWVDEGNYTQWWLRKPSETLSNANVMVNVSKFNRKRFNFLKAQLAGYRKAKTVDKNAVAAYVNGVLERYFILFPRDLTIDPLRKSKTRVGRTQRENVSSDNKVYVKLYLLTTKQIRFWLSNNTSRGRDHREPLYVPPAEEFSTTDEEGNSVPASSVRTLVSRKGKSQEKVAMVKDTDRYERSPCHWSQHIITCP